MAKTPELAGLAGAAETYAAYLTRLEHDVQAAEADLAEAKANAKTLKKAVERKVAALRAAIRSGKLPLFDHDAEGGGW